MTETVELKWVHKNGEWVRKPFILTRGEKGLSDKEVQPQLVAYQFVWTHRDQHGNWQYEYHCLWDDNIISSEITLPWSLMENATEVKDIYDLQKTKETKNEKL